MVSLDLAPGSGPAGAIRAIVSQAGFDARNALRNGENLLLTLVIPAAVLILILKTPVGGDRSPAQALVVSTSLAVLATAFTSQAIGTAFDRRYGVLRMLGLSPLGVRGLLISRALVSLLIIAVQTVVLVVLTGLLSGWWPADPARAGQAVVGILIAVWAYTALALLIAGTLRAEATLAVANAIFLVLMFGGGLAIPASALPWAGLTAWLPTGALVDVMSAPPLAAGPLAVLLAWAAVATVAAARFFRWED